jgi:hypothetical protein
VDQLAIQEGQAERKEARHGPDRRDPLDSSLPPARMIRMDSHGIPP